MPQPYKKCMGAEQAIKKLYEILSLPQVKVFVDPQSSSPKPEPNPAADSVGVTECPRCGNDWDINEIDSQECLNCGYPDSGELFEGLVDL